MKTTYLSITCLLVLNLSCKTGESLSRTVKDKNLGIEITMPKHSVVTDTLSLKGKYSGELYQVISLPSNENMNIKGMTFVHVYDNYYLIPDNIVMGYTYRKAPASEVYSKELDSWKYGTQGERIKGMIHSASVKSGGKGNYTYKEQTIYSELYYLYYYKVKNNPNDYFVMFETPFTKQNRIRGVICFPAAMSMQEIEKRTVELLQCFKFDEKWFE